MSDATGDHTDPPETPGEGDDAARGAGVPDTPSPTSGASAPQADVFSLADVKRKRERAIKNAASSPPPPPPDSATARSKGKGGDGRREKTSDFGKLNELTRDFALIYGTDAVWDGAKRMIMKISAMAHAHGSDQVKMWKASEHRRTIQLSDVIFDPTFLASGATSANLFGGIVMQPAESITEKDVQPILELIRFLCSRAGETADESDAIMHYLLCWFAYPLQHLGAKMRTAVIMHGEEGTGKNVLFETVLRIYGEYGALVGQDELEDKFNDWRSGKCFIVGDEVSSRAELVHNKNRLKSLVGSDSVQINPKNQIRRKETNHINVGFLSNEIQPLALDNTDRRYLVIYTPLPHPFEYYRKLGEWRDNGGTEMFYRYLLDYPLEGFEPYAPAPYTKAKEDLIDLNRKSSERFWREWQGGELDLPYWSCSAAQAYQAYLKYCQRTGERYPVQRPQFTRQVLRMSEIARSPMSEKVMAVDQEEGSERKNKSVRMLLIDPPPDGVKLGVFATTSVQKFTPELQRYLGVGFHSSAASGSGSGGDD